MNTKAKHPECNYSHGGRPVAKIYRNSSNWCPICANWFDWPKTDMTKQNTEAAPVQVGGELLLATQRAAIECAEQRDALAAALRDVMLAITTHGNAMVNPYQAGTFCHKAIEQARAALALAGGGK